MKSSERSIDGRWLVAAARGRKASILLAWLARHRDRLSVVCVGSPRWFVIVGHDRLGSRQVGKPGDAELEALRTIGYGPAEGGESE